MSQEEISEAWEAWEEQPGNSEEEWREANAQQVADKYSWSDEKCNSMVAAWFGGERGYGDAMAANRMHDTLTNEFGLDGQAIAEEFGARHQGRGGESRSQYYRRALKRTCKATIRDSEDLEDPYEIMDYEYELARAQHVYDESVTEKLTEQGSDTANAMYQCALKLSGAADTLGKLIDEFWVEAATIMYTGTVPSGVRYQNGSGGHYATGASAETGLGFGTYGTPLAGFVEDGTLDRDHYAVILAALSYEADSYLPAHAAHRMADWDHIVIAGSADLKVSEVIIESDGALKDEKTETLIDSSNVNSYPLFYASLAAAYVNQAAWVVENAPSAESIRAIEQGTPNAITNLANSNHGGAANRDFAGDPTDRDVIAANGVYDPETRAGFDKPQGAFESGDLWYAPKNSIAAVIHADQHYSGTSVSTLNNALEAWGPPQFTLAKSYDYAKAAVERLTKFYDNSGEAREIEVWLLERLGAIKGLMDIAEEMTNCIKDNYDDLLNELDRLNDDFEAALADEGWAFGWFKDSSLNEALATTVEAADLDVSGLVGGTAEKVIFRQQCFLLTYVNRLAGYKKYALETVVKDKRSICTKRLPYAKHDFYTAEMSQNTKENACLQVDGDPYGFINKLTQNPSYGKFFDIENWQASGLQPRIRLFKVLYDDNNEEREIELKFESNFSQYEMNFFKNKKSRGVGVGLKSFEFTYDGSNPFAAKKSIKAALKIHASSFSELFETRKGTINAVDDRGKVVPVGTADYSFAELALKTLFKERTGSDRASKWDLILNENANLAKLNFRLKAVVGWSKPAGNLGGLNPLYSDRGGPTAQEIAKASGESFVTLNLTPTVHTFDFDEQGRVSFTINYLAYVEDFFDQKSFNTFADPTGKIGLAREMRRLKMKKYSKECTDNDAQKVEELKKEYASEALAEQKCSISTIITELTRLEKIYYLQINPGILDSFVSFGPYAEKEHLVTNTSNLIYNSTDLDTLIKNDVATALQQATGGQGGYGAGADTDEELQQLRGALVGLSPNNTYVPFFYVSDLIDVLLVNIGKELDYLATNLSNIPAAEKTNMNNDDITNRIVEIKKFKTNFKRLRVLLGPVELKQHGTPRNYTSMRNAHNGISSTPNAATSFVNFGDLPISVSYFVEFLAEKVLRRENDHYSLIRMLNDFFNNLVSKFLNSKSCFAFDISQKVIVNQNVITSYRPTSEGNVDDITNLITIANKNTVDKKSPARLSLNDQVVKQWQAPGRPILNISGQSNQEGSVYAPLSHEINYLTFFAARTRPADRMTGDKAEDLQGGIFHYLLGRNKGIVKNIKLVKTQTPGLQEVRFEQEGYDGLEQLRVVYDVEIDCMANVNAFPGTYIYIPPRGFDPSFGMDMTKFGVGGYYMIYRSVHNFSSGDASTKVLAKWVASIGATAGPVPAQDEVSLSPSKCGLRGTVDGSGT